MQLKWALLQVSVLVIASLPGQDRVSFTHLSSTTGDLAVPNQGDQQTSAIVFDIDKDGLQDFVVTERTRAPSIVWYQRTASGWQRHVIDSEPLRIEAGSDVFDIDGDGDLDFCAGGDSRSNRVWWWENPYPGYQEPWERRVVKDFGATKHHDQLFGDFDGDGRTELVFWNQGACCLYLAEIPSDPRTAGAWECSKIYSWSRDSEMEQRGRYPPFKTVNEHEGLASCDIDGDGILDIVGGGRWFKYNGDGHFAENIVDAGYALSRAAAGQLIKGGRPEVVLVVGDGVAPMMLYEWKLGTWYGRTILQEVDGGHSLSLLDFDRDGNLDIFNAEMRLGGGNPDAKTRILLGDGKGEFETLVVSTGFGLHESKIADLDGDGDFDVLGKPYHWEAPRLDVWINTSATMR